MTAVLAVTLACTAVVLVRQWWRGDLGIDWDED